MRLSDAIAATVAEQRPANERNGCNETAHMTERFPYVIGKQKGKEKRRESVFRHRYLAIDGAPDEYK